MLPKFLRWIFGHYNQRVFNPSQFNGEINISGLNKMATIYWDKWHVPHIYAEDNVKEESWTYNQSTNSLSDGIFVCWKG